MVACGFGIGGSEVVFIEAQEGGYWEQRDLPSVKSERS